MTDETVADSAGGDDRSEAPGSTEHRDHDIEVTAPDPEGVPDAEDGPPPRGYGGPSEQEDGPTL